MFPRALRHARTQRFRRLAGLGVSLALVAAPLVLMPVQAGALHPLPGSPYVMDKLPDLAAPTTVEAHSGALDDSYKNGAAENDLCPNTENGSIPPSKADLSDFYIDAQEGSNGHTFLYLAWDRTDTNGTATIDFELNKSGEIKAPPACNGVNPTRGEGDLLVTYNFKGGQIESLEYRTWNDTTKQWRDAINLGSFADGVISENLKFGEMVVDLEGAGIFHEGQCVNFADAFTKSRSSDSLPSELKDFIAPVHKSITNCGSLLVTKHVSGGAGGESFDFVASCPGWDISPGVAGDSLAFSLKDGESKQIPDIWIGKTCSVEEVDVLASAWETKYSVNKASPALSGLTASGIVIALGEQTVDFYNNRLTGSLIIKKNTDVAGIFQFTVDCTDNRFDHPASSPISINAPGQTTISGIPTGTECTVAEVPNELFSLVVSPAGGHVTIASTASVTVIFTNTAKSNGIELDKKVNGGDHASSGAALLAHVGDTLHYTVKVTNTGDVPLKLTALDDSLYSQFAASCPQGLNTWLAAGASFTCGYDVTAADDAHNVASVDAVDGLNRTVSDLDETYVNVLKPAISVDKTATRWVHVGETINYEMTVKNIGDAALHAVSLEDPMCDSPPVRTSGSGDTLAVGASWTYSCSRVARAGDGDPIVNTVVAYGTDEGNKTVQDEATASTDVLHPAISVEKTATEMVHVGDPVQYSMVVTNTGDTDLFGFAIDDPKCESVPVSEDADSVLSPEEVWHFSCTHVAADSDANPIVNRVDVSASDRLEQEVSNFDTASTEILKPAIGVTKTGPAQLHVGDSADYTIVVTNPGNTPLHDVAVLDPKCDDDPVFAGSDADGFLSPGETWTYRCSRVIVDGDGDEILNTATASGTDALGEDVTAVANHPSVILRPAIAISKSGPTNAHVGDAVVYTLVVTNPGNTPLSAVSVIDSKCDGAPVLSGTDADGLLSPGEEWTYHCTHIATAADGSSILNTASATGNDPLGKTVEATANHTVVLLHPAISIVKTADPVSITDSGSVTYTYVITNSGDAVLHDVLVTDDVLGTIGSVGVLAPGESVTMAKTVNVDTTTPPTNIGTATGTDVLGQTVTSTDDATITVVLAAVEVLPELPRTGSPIQSETRAALIMLEVGIVMTLAGRRRRAGRRAD